MKQKKYNLILKSNYLSHFHTNYTDGHLSIEDYFSFCQKNHIDTLIFSEHVRKKMNYNFKKFCKEIKSISKKFPTIKYIIGVEAKFLPPNDLDINDDILTQVEALFFACHAFPNDENLFLNNAKNQFENKKYDHLIKIWAHPGRFFKKYPSKNENKLMIKLINIAQKNNVFIDVHRFLT